MAKFTVGQDPVKGLTELKAYMEEQTSKIKKATTEQEIDQLLVDTLNEYDDKMGSLSKIYKGGNEQVEQLKIDVRKLYEPLRDQFSHNHPQTLVGEFQIKLEEQRKQAKEEMRKLEQQREEQLKLEKQLEEEKQKLAKQYEEEKPTLENQQEETINQALQKVDGILQELTLKIDRVDQHQYKKAHDTANTLLKSLIAARDEYERDLRANEFSQELAGRKFKLACQDAVKIAKPVLEKDLGWGDYLKNLLKCLGNAVITIFTFGGQQGFFAYARPDSAKAVEKAEEDLGLRQTASSPQ
ncbi:lpg2327 family Dot/Icm T4SS effector [Legionella pneumophila]|uniref:Dot/Icm secretion system substrate n=1 Tax=Legionella pneumophila subsp. pascullei TaxID=91890 RepID=A0AAX2J1A3_LEGPN|nr:lpg2327 family Dot/Icm T4SS effector [Legionella pneumophila]AMP89118.1 type IV secretion protein Dot [Legionella pneumophila subsp. pascullei]AMP93215.1 type IV secretion protein Dot [Legionella pneumophila subsp. pascullei]AMP96181.1 type IV secretion protein Dot [Legionella pneumophila subsp. pascullei]SQG91129.1 Dot/Icm secretion system substrate [Legionella pneumophila subsp. pascullei]VEH07674.1 Dot/Icm secretion system substrate [Legionella pneumophila subsp. pascullei]